MVLVVPTCQCRRHKRHVFDPWVGKNSWRRKWQPTPVFLPEEIHGHRSLAGYSPWGHKESHTTERLTLTLNPYPAACLTRCVVSGLLSHSAHPTHCSHRVDAAARPPLLG